MSDGDLPARALGEEVAAGYRHGHATADPQCIYPGRPIPHVTCRPCAWHRTAYPAKELTAQ